MMQELEPSVARQEVPEPLRRAMGLKGRVLRCGRGRTLISEGEHATDVFVILEGRAQVMLYSPNGREVAVRHLAEGDLFGELAALDEAPRSATVVASSDLRVLTLGRQDFLECIDATPQAHDWLVARLVAEVRRLTEVVFELSALNVQSRLHCELLRLARAQVAGGLGLSIDPAPTHAELASRIGSHREAVTRELGVLTRRNIIRTRRRALEFLDIAGLEEEVARAVGAMGELLRTS